MLDFTKENVLDPVTEARRYVTNAKDLLEKNGQLANEIIDRCAKLLSNSKLQTLIP